MAEHDEVLGHAQVNTRGAMSVAPTFVTTPYSYSLDWASAVKGIVTAGAGAGRISV